MCFQIFCFMNNKHNSYLFSKKGKRCFRNNGLFVVVLNVYIREGSDSARNV